jgi:diguanylate cyclase (GGDEF)-like protein
MSSDISDASIRKHSALIDALAEYISVHKKRSKFDLILSEFCEATGFPENLWPNKTMDLLPLLTFFISDNPPEVDPTFMREMQFRLHPSETTTPRSRQQVTRTVATAILRRIDDDQEFTMHGIACETGISLPYIQQARNDLELEFPGQHMLSGHGFLNWGQKARDFLYTIAHPLDQDEYGHIEEPTDLRRDPTGHLIAQDHRRELLGLWLTEERPQMGPLSVLRIDLDKFKPINDTHGHGAGDQVLEAVYSAIADAVEGYAQPIRAGGDEVVVILPNFDISQAISTAERIRNTIKSSTIEYEGKPIGVTASIGVATSPPVEVSQLEEIADQRQYQAKKRGGDTVVSD